MIIGLFFLCVTEGEGCPVLRIHTMTGHHYAHTIEWILELFCKITVSLKLEVRKLKPRELRPHSQVVEPAFELSSASGASLYLFLPYDTATIGTSGLTCFKKNSSY